MARVRLHRSTSVRLAVIYLSLFLASFLGANVVAYTFVEAFLYKRLDANVTERFREISAAFDRAGIAGAKAMIDSHGPAISNGETLYALYDAQRRLLAGNIDLPDVAAGFSTSTPSDHYASSRNYRFLSGAVGDHRLTVGISYDDTNTLSNVTITSFSLATAIALATGLGSAGVLAVGMQRRISRLSDAMHAVAQGELGTRLPISGRLDEIDALAGEINNTLGRLQESVSTIKRVTTDIAHDLKTPIGRLFLQLEAAAESTSVEASRAMTQSALEEVRQITATFDALLRISQIEARARRTRVSNVDMRMLVADLFATYAPVFQDSGHHASFEDATRGASTIISGDRQLCRQMLVNVFDNAMRHTPRESRIAMTLFAEAEFATFVCADNGPGIPESEWTKVFRRFYRVDASRSTVGTGLGLSLVKAVVDFHDGSIQLEDNRPGLKLIIRLPLA